MKISIDEDREFVLSEVYAGVKINTDAGIFTLCQRDNGIEIRLGNGPWFTWQNNDGPIKLRDLVKKI